MYCGLLADYRIINKKLAGVPACFMKARAITLFNFSLAIVACRQQHGDKCFMAELSIILLMAKSIIGSGSSEISNNGNLTSYSR